MNKFLKLIRCDFCVCFIIVNRTYWFSSYVYESLEVDTIHDLIVSDLKESMVDFN